MIERIYATIFVCCAFVLSCKSPNEPQAIPPQASVPLKNIPPVILVTPNITALQIGDTLKISLHVSDTTLLNGLLDFGDGRAITFAQTGRHLDTIVEHIYSRLGVFSVKATFSDGELSTTDSVLITVQRYFELSLKPGTVWRFSHTVSSTSPATFYHYNERGIYTWKIISFTVAGHDTFFNAQQTVQDSVEEGDDLGHFDTTYIVQDTSQFSIYLGSVKVTFSSLLRGT